MPDSRQLRDFNKSIHTNYTKMREVFPKGTPTRIKFIPITREDSNYPQ